MVKIERTFPAPKSLAIESQNKWELYRNRCNQTIKERFSGQMLYM